MAKTLVIVESPAKAKTISKYLGDDFEVKASVGHIKDLPKKKLGVEVAKDFQATYEVIPGKEKIIQDLRRAAARADRIFLAADPAGRRSHLPADFRRSGRHQQGRLPGHVFRDHPGRSPQGLRHAAGNQRQPGAGPEHPAHPGPPGGYKVSPLLWRKVRQDCPPAACRRWPCRSSWTGRRRSGPS